MSFYLNRSLGTSIFLNGQKLEVVDHDFHLGNYVATDLRDIGSNNVISDFNACDSITLDDFGYRGLKHFTYTDLL